MGNDDYEVAPVVQLRTEEEVARAREQLEALRNAPPSSVDFLIKVSLENALRALEAALPPSVPGGNSGPGGSESDQAGS